MTAVAAGGAPAQIAANEVGGMARARGWGRRALRGLVSAVVSVAILLAVWWAFLRLFDVDPFIGRTPADVWRWLTSGPEAAAHRTTLLDAWWITLRDACLGLVAGTAVAAGCALTFNLWRAVEHTVMPVAVVLQSVPLVAFTPLIALVFGRGLVTTTVIVGIVTFFPTMVNLNLALRSAPAQSVDLLWAYGASRTATLRKAQLPCAVPALFASLRIAAPLALVGALLAEWLATGTGLGRLMLESMTTFELDQLWAAVALITAFSIVLFNAVSVIEAATLARFAPIDRPE